ncbi:hypothetical protein FQR65_LT05975 [Abscondita terminalis]|nr:hypothetical protein FQR65_LT05975 [Abscondita terminalis]
MSDDEVKEILSKYQKQETHINHLLQQNTANLKCALENVDEPEKRFISLDDAVKRNKLILKVILDCNVISPR